MSKTKLQPKNEPTIAGLVEPNKNYLVDEYEIKGRRKQNEKLFGAVMKSLMDWEQLKTIDFRDFYARVKAFGVDYSDAQDFFSKYMGEAVTAGKAKIIPSIEYQTLYQLH